VVAVSREVIVQIRDDLDREFMADETVEITFDGTVYVLDLCKRNSDLLRRQLRPWLQAAHETRKVKSNKTIQNRNTNGNKTIQPRKASVNNGEIRK
jgi:Lsr2 protein